MRNAQISQDPMKCSLLRPLPLSGSATVDEEANHLLLENDQGFNLYDMRTDTTIATYKMPQSRTTESKSLKFGETGSIVVAGSDEGKAFVFDRMGGNPIGVLQHARRGMVQSITVCLQAPHIARHTADSLFIGRHFVTEICPKLPVRHLPMIASL